MLSAKSRVPSAEIQCSGFRFQGLGARHSEVNTKSDTEYGTWHFVCWVSECLDSLSLSIGYHLTKIQAKDIRNIGDNEKINVGIMFNFLYRSCSPSLGVCVGGLFSSIGYHLTKISAKEIRNMGDIEQMNVAIILNFLYESCSLSPVECIGGPTECRYLVLGRVGQGYG